MGSRSKSIFRKIHAVYNSTSFRQWNDLWHHSGVIWTLLNLKTKSRLNISCARNNFIIGPGKPIHRIGDCVEIHAAKEITLDLKINHISGPEIDSNHTDSHPVYKQPGVTNYISNNSIVVATTPYVDPVNRFLNLDVQGGPISTIFGDLLYYSERRIKDK